MKKGLKLVCVLLLCAFLMGGFASCTQAQLRRMNETDRAFALYDRVFMGEMPRSVKSYTILATISMQMTVQGIDVTVTGNGDMRYTDKEICEKLSVKTDVAGETSKVVTLEGYVDGTMFRSQKVDGKYVQKLKSEITQKEYEKFRENRVMGLNFEPSELAYCATVSCIENNGGWKAVYTDFYESGMEPYRNLFADYDELLADSFRLVDMEITLTVDEKLQPEQVKMVPVFEKVDESSAESLPTIEFLFKFQDYNKTSQTSLPDLNEYDEVGDIRVLDTVEDAIKARLEAENGRFTTVISAESENGKGKSKATESYEVSYSTKDGKLSHTMRYKAYTGSVDLNKNHYLITYKDRRVEKQDLATLHTQTHGSNDEAQWNDIRQLMNYIPFDAGSITEIVVDENENGLYTFTAEIKDLDAYQSAADSIGAKNLSGTVTYTVKIFEEKIIRFEAVQVITAGNKINFFRLEIKASCVFND